MSETLELRLSDPSFQRRRAAQLLATRIGHILRMARLNCGMSVPEVSGESGVSERAIKDIERGERLNATIAEIALIAFVLDVHLDFRLSHPGDPS